MEREKTAELFDYIPPEADDLTLEMQIIIYEFCMRLILMHNRAEWEKSETKGQFRTRRSGGKRRSAEEPIREARHSDGSTSDTGT
jgi:hypothetical protein